MSNINQAFPALAPPLCYAYESSYINQAFPGLTPQFNQQIQHQVKNQEFLSSEIPKITLTPQLHLSQDVKHTGSGNNPAFEVKVKIWIGGMVAPMFSN